MRPCDVQQDFHIPNHSSYFYDIDRSCTVFYQWNSLGFRGEEYNPYAKFTLCVVGESNAVGVGIKLEETFGYLLKFHISECLGYDPADVNLINLSAAGASADYCIRTLYRQLLDCAVDLVVCQLPHPGRTEYRDGEGYHTCNVNAVRTAKLQQAPPPLLAYCDYYTEAVGMTNLIKNVLQAQALLRARKIDHIIATQFLPRSPDKRTYLDDYFHRLDTSSVLWHRYFVKILDRAADTLHAGPRSHAVFAIELLDVFGRIQSRRGRDVIGRIVEARAAELRRANKDWAYWNVTTSSKESGQGPA